MRAHLPTGWAPAGEDDARWLGDADLDGALTKLWAGPAERGLVVLSPAELDVLESGDIPAGVGIGIDGKGDGVLRRGSRAWPLAVDAELGAERIGWDNVLDVVSYTILIRTAAEARGSRTGDVDHGYDDRHADGPDGVTLRVRVRLRECRPAHAFRSAQAVLASLRSPADAAERAARRAVAAAVRRLGAQ